MKVTAFNMCEQEPLPCWGRRDKGWLGMFPSEVCAVQEFPSKQNLFWYEIMTRSVPTAHVSGRSTHVHVGVLPESSLFSIFHARFSIIYRDLSSKIII